MIAKVRKYNFDEVARRFEDLIELAENGNIHDMVLTMKEIVPEYVSNNSVFQDIDRELHHKSSFSDAPEAATSEEYAHQQVSAKPENLN